MRNLFQLIRDFFRNPAMIGTPPSERSMWHNPAAHARDFAQRYAEPMNYHVENRMMELGIDPAQIGVSDPDHGIRHAAFMPHEADGGGNSPDGRLNLDSGILNSDLFERLGPTVSDAYAKARTAGQDGRGDRHEYEEVKGGGSHEYAFEICSRDGTADPTRSTGASSKDQGWRATTRSSLIHSSRRSHPARVNRNTDSGPPAHVETGYMIRAADNSR